MCTHDHVKISFLVSLLFVALVDLCNSYSLFKFLMFYYSCLLIFIGHNHYNKIIFSQNTSVLNYLCKMTALSEYLDLLCLLMGNQLSALVLHMEKLL